jgi:hypothetical protein
VRDFGWAHAAIIATKRDASVAEPPVMARAPAARPAQPPVSENSELSLAELFFSAESAARRMLLESLGSVEAETPQSVQPVETNRALEEAALRRDRAGFVKLLESALGLSHQQAERIVGDESGEPLLVAAKALAMPSVALQRVLMFIDPTIGESVDRFFDLAALYEKVSADAAHKLIASVRGREPARPRRAAHRPMYYDDEAGRSRRGALRRTGVAEPRVAAAEPQAPARTATGTRQPTT